MNILSESDLSEGQVYGSWVLYKITGSLSGRKGYVFKCTECGELRFVSTGVQYTLGDYNAHRVLFYSHKCEAFTRKKEFSFLRKYRDTVGSNYTDSPLEGYWSELNTLLDEIVKEEKRVGTVLSDTIAEGVTLGRYTLERIIPYMYENRTKRGYVLVCNDCGGYIFTTSKLEVRVAKEGGVAWIVHDCSKKLSLELLIEKVLRITGYDLSEEYKERAIEASATLVDDVDLSVSIQADEELHSSSLVADEELPSSSLVADTNVEESSASKDSLLPKEATYVLRKFFIDKRLDNKLSELHFEDIGTVINEALADYFEKH